MSDKLAIGIDVGGTFIKFALVDEKGVILKKESIPTIKDNELFVQSIATTIKELLNGYPSVVGIGIGVPGNVNSKEGKVVGCYNLPQLENLPIAKDLQNKFALPILLDNDANNAVKGEYLFGAGKSFHDLILLTVGTGIGGGIILNGQIHHGATHYGGEIGHLILFPDGVLCSCGNYGCFEAYASTTALINYVKQSIKRGFSSKINEIPYEKISGKTICQFANEGDSVCRDALEKIGQFLAIGCASLINILNVPLIIIGGGISEGGEILFQSINSHVNKLVLPNLRNSFEIKKAILGNDAGVIGSASSIFLSQGIL